jgi:hypothetical protein
MTLITFQGNDVILRAGKVGTEQACCCQCDDPCSLCHSPCLSVTFSGFEGETEPCDECSNLNGTYVLTRGEGYQPEITLAIKAITGYGAVLTPTIAYDNADGSYSITGVTIDKAGTCYSADASVVVKIVDGFVACGDDPLFSVTVGREEPLLDLSYINDSLSPAGTGAELTPVYTPSATTPGAETWSLDSVTVTANGQDYDNLAAVKIQTKGCTVTISPAVARVRTVATIPVQSATFIETTAGTGATFSVTWSPRSLPPFPASGHLDGIPHWDPVVSASGGTGYVVNDTIKVTLSAQHYSGSGPLSQRAGSWIVGGVTAVDGSGAITGVTAIPVAYYRSDGSIDSVEVLDGGEYYTPGGIESVEVLNPGTIWPDETCQVTLCEPTECKYGSPAETKCRTISLLSDSDGYHLTVRLSPDDSVIYSASVSPEGNACNDLEFDSEAVESSSCTTIGTVTVAGVTCDGPPPEESCCKPPCETVFCPDDCDSQVLVEVEFCNLTATLQVPIPGSASLNYQDPDSDSYIIIDASMVCGCDDWLLTVSVCAYCEDTNEFASDGFTATIRFSGNEEPDGGYCPEDGPITLECFGEQFGIPCKTTVTAVLE